MSNLDKYSLENLNMVYIGNDSNCEEIECGAILHCAHDWTLTQLYDWLPKYNLDMLESVINWLINPSEVSEGGYLKVWVD